MVGHVHIYVYVSFVISIYFWTIFALYYCHANIRKNIRMSFFLLYYIVYANSAPLLFGPSVTAVFGLPANFWPCGVESVFLYKCARYTSW